MLSCAMPRGGGRGRERERAGVHGVYQIRLKKEARSCGSVGVRVREGGGDEYLCTMCTLCNTTYVSSG